MPQSTSPTPEDIFWSRIEAEPGNPLPRLLFADWCDENDRPVMSEVQRWLATTGRYPGQSGHWWFWTMNKTKLIDGVAQNLCHALPQMLFDQLLPPPPAFYSGAEQFGTIWCFSNLRSSEEALAQVWRKARRWRRLVFRFRPDYASKVARPEVSSPEQLRLDWYRSQKSANRFSDLAAFLFSMLFILVGFAMVWGAARYWLK